MTKEQVKALEELELKGPQLHGKREAALRQVQYSMEQLMKAEADFQESVKNFEADITEEILLRNVSKGVIQFVEKPK